MIKPALLWSLFKTCDDSKWLGDICRALGRQKLELDFGQKQMMASIMQDSEWHDERVEEEREKARVRIKAWRAKRGGESDSSSDSTSDSFEGEAAGPQEGTALPDDPLIKKIPDEKFAVEYTRKRYPRWEDVKLAARQFQIPDDYAKKWFDEMTACDWCYASGLGTKNLTRANFKMSFRNFWKKEKEEREKLKKEGNATAKDDSWKEKRNQRLMAGDAD